MENLNFIFDIDGTLTPSRRKIDPDFHEYFLDFAHKNDVYLVCNLISSTKHLYNLNEKELKAIYQKVSK